MHLRFLRAWSQKITCSCISIQRYYNPCLLVVYLLLAVSQKKSVEILDRTFSTKKRIRTNDVRIHDIRNKCDTAGMPQRQQRVCTANCISQNVKRTILRMHPFMHTTRKVHTPKYSHLRRVLRTSLINS